MALFDRIKEIVDAHTSVTETTVGCRTKDVPVIWSIDDLLDDIRQAIEAHEGEILDALRDLVAAHVAHKQATEKFLAAGGEEEIATTDELRHAESWLAEEATAVATLAMQQGIQPSEEAE